MKKTILIIVVVLIATIALAYGAMVLYEIVMSDVEIRLQNAIAEGIREGIHDGLGSVVNPVNWAQSLIRGQ
jgi:hypothetical protein